VEGEPEAVRRLRPVAESLSSHVVEIAAADKARYHAAAVMASNFLPPLLDAACRLLERAGIPYDEALPALLPLVRGTLSNIEERGLEASVTGPIPRGDVETVDLHLRALDPHDKQLYAVLGRELVRIAGPLIPEDALKELLERFETEVDA